MKQHLMYTHKLNDAEVGYDINRALFIDATPDGTINKIKYRLTSFCRRVNNFSPPFQIQISELIALHRNSIAFCRILNSKR
jgi:hypothetical protein